MLCLVSIKLALCESFHPRKFLYEFGQELLVAIVRCAKSTRSFVVKKHLGQLSQIQGQMQTRVNVNKVTICSYSGVVHNLKVSRIMHRFLTVF